MSAAWCVRIGLAAGVLGLVACAGVRTQPQPVVEAVSAQQFVSRLTPYCGRAFPGRVLEDRPVSPEAIWQEPAVVHLRCEREGMVLALSLGEDRSRVWLLGRTRDGLHLSHAHNHPDGSPDAVTGYGGIAVEPLTSIDRVEFPADELTRHLFVSHGLEDALANVWAFEFADEHTLVYELKRPGRLFRLAFDLSSPMMPPPLPWAEMAVQ